MSTQDKREPIVSFVVDDAMIREIAELELPDVEFWFGHGVAIALRRAAEAFMQTADAGQVLDTLFTVMEVSSSDFRAKVADAVTQEHIPFREMWTDAMTRYLCSPEKMIQERLCRFMHKEMDDAMSKQSFWDAFISREEVAEMQRELHAEEAG